MRAAWRSISAFTLLLVVPFGARGQTDPEENKPTLEKIRALHLQNAAGQIPVYCSAGFESRALKYQKSLITCQQWYDKQVASMLV